MTPIKVLVAAICAATLPTFSLAQAQFQRGMIWEDNRYNSIPVYYGNSPALPASKSLRVYYPKVVIQPKSDFTDVAWAAIWNARTAAEAIACNQIDPLKIREMAFAPAYNYTIVRKQPDCYAPVSLIDILESMVRNGTPYFSEFREFCATEIPVEAVPLANTKKLSGYYKLFNPSDIANVKELSVKNAIAANGAVVVGMICPPSFQMAQDVWTPRETKPDQQYGGHTVCVVGYDNTKFGGAFEVINTWGKEWGKEGFTWIKYKDFADYVQYGFGLFQLGSSACSVPFEASVKFKMLNGEEMSAQIEGAAGQYKFARSYPSGTTFTIEMSSTIPGYIYSFGVDPSSTVFPLYPRLSTTLPISFTTLRAPDDMPAITLTDPPGKNSVYFIFSPFEIDISKALAKLKGRRVITPTDVQSALGSMSTEPVTWDEAALSFTGKLTGPVVMQVVLDQTRK